MIKTGTTGKRPISSAGIQQSPRNWILKSASTSLVLAFVLGCSASDKTVRSEEGHEINTSIEATDSVSHVSDSSLVIDSSLSNRTDSIFSSDSTLASIYPRVPKPDSIRALYVNGWAAGSRSRMANLIRIAEESEINSFIIDIKESDTYLTYSGTSIPLALEIGAHERPASRWLPALVDTLKAHGIYSIARIVVFKDRMLAEKKPELAIRHVDGSVWKDNKGGPWVNPYDKRVWDYNIAIAKEALDMGFSELQWDYVRFPDVTNTARSVMRYPGSDSVSRSDNIRNFIVYSKEQLKQYSVPITADVFGLVTHLEGDVEIGQNWESIVAVSDAVLPMVYPSHYASGLYGFSRPISNPYQIVRMALTDAVERTKWLADSLKTPTGEIIPWLEAMSIRGASYGAAELRAQIQATYNSGLKSWALWNPGSRYAEFEGAFRTSSGELSAIEKSGWTAPEFVVPRNRLSTITRKRDQRKTADSSSRSDSLKTVQQSTP